MRMKFSQAEVILNELAFSSHQADEPVHFLKFAKDQAQVCGLTLEDLLSAV